jgi:hypothetical protein
MRVNQRKARGKDRKRGERRVERDPVMEWGVEKGE